MTTFFHIIPQWPSREDRFMSWYPCTQSQGLNIFPEFTCQLHYEVQRDVNCGKTKPCKERNRGVIFLWASSSSSQWHVEPMCVTTTLRSFTVSTLRRSDRWQASTWMLNEFVIEGTSTHVLINSPFPLPECLNSFLPYLPSHHSSSWCSYITQSWENSLWLSPWKEVEERGESLLVNIL